MRPLLQVIDRVRFILPLRPPLRPVLVLIIQHIFLRLLAATRHLAMKKQEEAMLAQLNSFLTTLGATAEKLREVGPVSKVVNP